jgi:hypothetical protein
MGARIGARTGARMQHPGLILLALNISGILACVEFSMLVG